MTRLCVVLLFAVVFFGCGAAPSPAPQADPSAAPDAPAPASSGAAIVEAKCGTCHGLDKVNAKRATAEEWTVLVGKMRQLGASLTDEEAAAAVTHLANQPTL